MPSTEIGTNGTIGISTADVVAFPNTGNTFTGTVNCGYQMSFGGLGDSSNPINFAGGSGLTKIGAGTLLLTGPNAYDGTTAVQAGALEVGGALSGIGNTVVADNASLTAGSIVQTTLSIGAGASVTISATPVSAGGAGANAVPEPGTWALIGIGLLTLLAFGRRPVDAVGLRPAAVGTVVGAAVALPPPGRQYNCRPNNASTRVGRGDYHSSVRNGEAGRPALL